MSLVALVSPPFNPDPMRAAVAALSPDLAPLFPPFEDDDGVVLGIEDVDVDAPDTDRDPALALAMAAALDDVPDEPTPDSDWGVEVGHPLLLALHPAVVDLGLRVTETLMDRRRSLALVEAVADLVPGVCDDCLGMPCDCFDGSLELAKEVL